MNPFKFGTIVGEDFFTDRIEEVKLVQQMLDSENHLVIISPRRFGKSSLVAKVLGQIDRPSITIDLMKVLSTEDLAVQITREIFRLFKLEKVKHLLSHFRIAPTVSYNALTDGWDVSFNLGVSKAETVLEDAMVLLEKVSTQTNKLIVVFDEFQEVNEIDKNLARQLRAIMQRQNGLNYIFMGSQESMMEEIFEKKKSPFYHFGQRMNLKKIPHDDFLTYIVNRLPNIISLEDKTMLAEDILLFTNDHPYYTQQLASSVYNLMEYDGITEDIVESAIQRQVQEHDLDYERLWQAQNRTDRKVLALLANKRNPLTERSMATSTAFSSLKRLVKQGYVNRLESYELEDPFFGRWMLEK